MRCLILGGDGMLGHQLLISLQQRHDVRVTLRRPLADYSTHSLFHETNAFAEVDAGDTDRLLQIIGDFRPDAVINCIGIIKQRPTAKDAILSIETNSLLPHRLRLICAAAGARLVHFSTDCIYNGREGRYRQAAPANAEDLYGLSKYLGEVHEAPAVTIRSSIIGLELSRKNSLVEWFLAQRGTIKGFVHAIYTGVTTLEMARLVDHLLVREPDLHGVWQVASEPISKYELLRRLATMLHRDDIEIVADESFHCDRSLVGSEFTARTGYQVPSWDCMLHDLADQIQGRKLNETS